MFIYSLPSFESGTSIAGLLDNITMLAILLSYIPFFLLIYYGIKKKKVYIGLYIVGILILPLYYLGFDINTFSLTAGYLSLFALFINLMGKKVVRK